MNLAAKFSWKDEIKQNMTPTLIALERKAKNDPGLNAYFWRLGPSWKL